MNEYEKLYQEKTIENSKLPLPSRRPKRTRNVRSQEQLYEKKRNMVTNEEKIFRKHCASEIKQEQTQEEPVYDLDHSTEEEIQPDYQQQIEYLKHEEIPSDLT